MKILLVGSGGREHALATKLLDSPKTSQLICAPGNAGMAQMTDCVDIAADDIAGLVKFAQDEAIDFVVVGPEQPLSLGIVDAMAKINIPAFGPNQAAAQLESSKAFMKDFCKRNAIPTARYEVFTEIEPAKAFLKTLTAPYVIKTDGLAAGKGVAIPETLEQAEAELEAYFSGKFGDAGRRLIIEEFMTGEEVSFFALCDGKTAIPFGAAQDHKRVGEGDTGPNTGGMGAYAPAPVFTPDAQKIVMDTIITPTVKGMAEEGYAFAGILFAGLMMTPNGPKLIEYNVRFGDPECQVIMRMLSSDLVEAFYAASTQSLNELAAPLFTDQPTVNVVMCTNGYPGSYAKGSVIKNIDAANAKDGVHVFHAGTKRGSNGDVLASGGRVLNVTAQGQTLKAALDAAYEGVDAIDWPDGFVRRDIGWRAL